MKKSVVNLSDILVELGFQLSKCRPFLPSCHISSHLGILLVFIYDVQVVKSPTCSPGDVSLVFGVNKIFKVWKKTVVNFLDNVEVGF